MSTKAIEEALAKLDGPNHHDRDALLARNGRWGTCGACPRGDDGRVEPERCEYTSRSDHNLKRPNDEAWAELEAIERAAKVLKAWNDAGQPGIMPDAARAWSLLESIAKDAK